MASTAVIAQHDQHRHDASEKLGDVNFIVSCTPQAQKHFNHAVAWLHSFEYEEAAKALGELLLELKQPAAALQEFETSLRSAPERFNGVYGAARAASLAADEKKARTYYQKLLALTQQADTPRSEISEAKAFLAAASRLTHR